MSSTSTTYSLHRVGGETQLGASSAVVAAAPLQSGQFAAVSTLTASSGPQIEIRLLNAAGKAAHAPIDLTAGPAGASIVDPEITALTGGGSVVTWLSAYSHGLRAHYAVLDSHGNVLANATASNTATTVEAVALPNGGFDLALAQSNLFGTQTTLSLEARSVSGALTAAAHVVDTSSNTTGTQGYNDLEGVSTGSGVELFWDNGAGVHSVLVDSAGTAHHADLSSSSASGVQASVLDNGQVALAWAVAHGSGSQVMTETVDPAAVAHGSALASAIAVATSSLAPGLADPQVESVGQGRYALSWRPDASHDASAEVFSAAGAAGPVIAGVGDLAGVGAGGTVYSLAHHGGSVWFDQYVDPPAAASASAHAAAATPAASVSAPPASVPTWAAAYEADMAAALHQHVGLWA